MSLSFPFSFVMSFLLSPLHLFALLFCFFYSALLVLFLFFLSLRSFVCFLSLVLSSLLYLCSSLLLFSCFVCSSLFFAVFSLFFLFRLRAGFPLTAKARTCFLFDARRDPHVQFCDSLLTYFFFLGFVFFVGLWKCVCFLFFIFVFFSS